MPPRHSQLPVRWPLALLLGAFLLLTSVAWPAMIRGRLERNSVPGRAVPAAGISVTVINPKLGRSAPATSGPDGMYYLNMPPGDYTLEIWISSDPRQRPILVPIHLEEPYLDVKPVKVP